MCDYVSQYYLERVAKPKDAKEVDSNLVLTKDMIDKIFQLHNNKLEEIAFYGGEPLLPDTKGIIQYIISKAQVE